MKTLLTIGENHLIETLKPLCPLGKNVLVGPGDDCAVIENQTLGTYTLIKTDTVVEGVHYLKNADPYWVGWKAVARVVSDFAAMAGQPDSLVVAIAMQDTTEVSYLTEIYKGIQACAKAYNFSIVGGETSSSPVNIITVSGTGYTDKYVTRSGAKKNNNIYVTGKLGGSIRGKHLTFLPRVQEASWLSNNTSLTAMMDLSDGLAKDLPRLADSSGVGFFIEADKLPCNESISPQQALSDGEDYELLFTTSAPLKEKQLQQWNIAFPDLALTQIGHITDTDRTHLTGGWTHFSTKE